MRALVSGVAEFLTFVLLLVALLAFVVFADAIANGRPA